MISPTPTAPAQLRLRFAIGAVVLTLLGAHLGACMHKVVQGVQQGAQAGNKAAGPVGGVLGGAIGGVVGVFTGVLGAGQQPQQGAAAGEWTANKPARPRPRREPRATSQGRQGRKQPAVLTQEASRN